MDLLGDHRPGCLVVCTGFADGNREVCMHARFPVVKYHTDGGPDYAQGNMSSYKHCSDTAWLRAVVTRKAPNGSDRKTEMCSIFDVYDKCVRKGVKNACKGNEQRKERSSD